jgi:hypothetical protein
MLPFSFQTVYILKSINQKMYARGILSDLAKAFDCVNHEILLAILQYIAYPIRAHYIC